MRLLTGFVCVLALLAGAGRAADEPQSKAVKEELARLQGTWKIVSYTKDGVELSAEDLKELPTVTFKGPDYRWSEGPRNGTIARIDPTQKPKTIDYKITDGDDMGKTQLAIYEIQGDTFKDCLAPLGAERPKDLSAKAGSGHTLIVYERVK
jgi:uncharacterized protein (TIGR03067 family)